MSEHLHKVDSQIPCVSPSVPPEDPVVDGSPELLLMAGTPYNLTCVTRGAKPAAHIQWTKDGVGIEGAYHSTVIYMHTLFYIKHKSIMRFLYKKL